MVTIMQYDHTCSIVEALYTLISSYDVSNLWPVEVSVGVLLMLRKAFMMVCSW